MGHRSVRSRRTTDSTERDRNQGRQSRSDRSRTTRAEAQHRYGLDVEEDADLLRLRRLEEQFGRRQLRAWHQEGVPLQAMGDADGIARFREREGTPVPWNVEEHNEHSVQRSERAAADAAPAGEAQVPDTVRDVIASRGQALDASIQRAMEERMGDSLGDVRIHTGPQAAQACEDVNARAFTVGNHVAFNRGEYDPSSSEGQHVLAHELAHVRQQTGGAVSMLPQEDIELEIDPDPQLEREAEETAQRVMAGGKLGIQRLADTEVHVQRTPKSARSLEQCSELFDLQNYIDDASLVGEGGAIDSEAGRIVTGNMRKEINGLPERDDTDPPYSVNQNVAFAILSLNGTTLTVAVASGKRRSNETEAESPLLPGPYKDERHYDHRNEDNTMDPAAMWCTEPKLLEHVTREYDPATTEGEILLFTERPPCDAGCEELIERFTSDYPGVELRVTHDPDMEAN